MSGNFGLMRLMVKLRNSLILTALAAALSGCGRIGALTAPSAEPGSKSVLAAQGRGLLGQGAAALDSAGRKQALMAEYKALEYKKTGESVAWSSGKMRASGTVIAGQPYKVGAQNCRQYSHNWTIDGVPYMARGSACRNADGSWTPLD